MPSLKKEITIILTKVYSFRFACVFIEISYSMCLGRLIFLCNNFGNNTCQSYHQGYLIAGIRASACYKLSIEAWGITSALVALM